MHKSEIDKIREDFEKLLKLKEIENEKLKKENIQIKDEKNEIEVKFNEIEKIRTKNKIPLLVILNGVPKFTFMKFNRSETEAKNKNFKHHKKKKIFEIILKDITDLKLDMKKINLLSSKFFDETIDFENKQIEYSSENSIQNFTIKYMSDIFEILGINDQVKYYDTTKIITAISEEESKILNYPDITIVRTRRNKPIIAIEIKIPNLKILEDDNVIGQIYDYMLSIRSFYNQENVYGILTTLDKWKILYLPKKKNLNLEKRTIYETRIYDFSDPHLAKTLITVIKNSLESKYYPIEIFDEKRNYIEYSSEGCRWKRINRTELDFLEKEINIDIYKSCKKLTYTIYKFFQTGRTNQTSLIINNCGSIGVLKQFFGRKYNDENIKTEELETFEFEASMWKKIYNINTEIQLINNRPTFLMPLIFTLEQKYDKSLKINKVFFRTDLSKIFTYEGAIPAELPITMRYIQSKIKDFSKGKNIIKSAEYAIKKLAEKNYVHKDLKWEHIGLYPILENGVIKEMEPVLIDLESLKKKSMEKSEKKMLKKLEKMSENCVFINNDDDY